MQLIGMDALGGPYAYGALGLGLLLGAFGLPVPTTLLATLGGALVAGGELDPLATVGIALLACVLGDLGGYAVGRRGGRHLLRRQQLRLAQAEQLFSRWAALTLLLSRSVLSIAGAAVNITAGATGQPLASFAGYSLLGRAIWVALFVGLGYLGADRAAAAADLVSGLSGLLGMLGIAGLVLLAARPRPLLAHAER
jgi:membrane protein DedA with SNARE-associated domain